MTQNTRQTPWFAVRLAFCLILVCFYGCAGKHWEPLSGQDVFLLLVGAGIQTVDCGQTLALVNDPAYREMNPILGADPSRNEVWAWMIGSLITKVVVTWYLDPKDRPVWEVGTSLISLWAVTNNMDEGLSPRF